MGTEDPERQFLKNHDPDRYKKPTVMVDISIFTLREQRLSVLLIKRGEHPDRGQWSLPGGAVHVDPDGPSFDSTLEDAARRELKEETGVAARYLEQVKTYGSVFRDPRDWTVSVSYFALIDSSEIDLIHGTDAADARWVTVKGRGVHLTLAFDHKLILSDAIQRLRSKVEYTAIAACLLPAKFTLAQLQAVYETLLQERIHKRTFYRSIEQSSLIVPLSGQFTGSGRGRKAQLYRYTPKKDNSLFFPRSIVWAERHGEHK